MNFFTLSPEVEAGDWIQLQWSTTNATQCYATGGWQNQRATAGNESVGPINEPTTFALRCVGEGGEAVASLSVNVLQRFSVQWQPPTSNVDGTPVDPIVEYRLHHGETSGAYSDVTTVNGGMTQVLLTSTASQLYVAMTAVDHDGEESDLSNEVLILAQ